MEDDYQTVYYIMDALTAVVFLITIKLDVTLEKSVEKVSKALLKFLNPAALIFFAINFFIGTSFGVADTYVGIFLHDTQDASFSFIG